MSAPSLEILLELPLPIAPIRESGQWESRWHYVVLGRHDGLASWVGLIVKATLSGENVAKLIAPMRLHVTQSVMVIW